MTRAEAWRLAAAIAAISLIQAAALFLEGHPLISASGHVYLWEGAVLSAENSQQLTDWYTFSHVIHGFLFYAFFWFLFPRMGVFRRLLLAVALEATWEIVENTPWLIDRYREQALAQGYWGDSIINSLSDTLSAIVGYVLASRLPVRVTVGVALLLEAFVGYGIRDNLTLNVLNLLHRFEFIQRWQSGL